MTDYTLIESIVISLKGFAAALAIFSPVIIAGILAARMLFKEEISTNKNTNTNTKTNTKEQE